MDIGKIADVARMADIFISLDKAENNLNEDAINKYIQKSINVAGVTCSIEELAALKRNMQYKYQIFTTPGQSILADYFQNDWYTDCKAKIVPKFWTRYKNYLIDEKHFSPNVVSTLGEDTLDQKLMNYILDPKEHYTTPVLKRGLIIGDVQSGKTSTYIGFLCKAADAGYKVFILLTGITESLRKQTQERVEEGFIGIDMSAESKDGRKVGVGLDNQGIWAISMTSRVSDFVGDNDKTVISLASVKDAIVFVIKKNANTLQKLTKWLVELNADKLTKKINMPMLMIDDEADNASINTSASKEDPTRINKLIRELASVFTVSNYVGFTATPFANVFIDPETTEKMETQDLFPEDFIVALPTPSNYIGPNRIFAQDGEYHDQLVYIKDAGREEEDGFPFYFKHKKEWAGELPDSLTDAVYAFYIVNAIRDLRGDYKAHRSMLINISRFVAVQKHIKAEVEEIHGNAYRAIKFNLSADEQSLKDPVLYRIHEIWSKYYSHIEFSWEEIAEAMYQAIEKIQIKVVNSSKTSEKLEYPKDVSLRVIAIGGLALSRGLTLEGLIISYFYRNTSTYDVLMQMGRWFGYRKNYEDLFRIWTCKDSADWYAEIAEATDELKKDMQRMRDLGLKPKDFGIRVRNNSSDLQITSYNKMRNSTDEYEMRSYFGDIIETAYLNYNVNSHINNYTAVSDFVDNCISHGKLYEKIGTVTGVKRYMINDVPKSMIIDLLKRLQISRFNNKFDILQVVSFLNNCQDQSIDLFDVVFIEGDEKEEKIFKNKPFYRVLRRNCRVDQAQDRLNIGNRGKLGGTSDGIAGIVDFNGKTAQRILEDAEKSFLSENSSKNFPSNTWFKYVKDRKPALFVYFIDVEGENQIDLLRDELGEVPVTGFALGLPRNDEAAALSATRYRANKIYNWFERDEMDIGDEE